MQQRAGERARKLTIAAIGTAVALCAGSAVAAVKAPAGEAPLIRIDEIVEGVLDDGDPALDDGTHYECFAVTGRPGALVTITMRSLEFDAFLLAGYGGLDECETFVPDFQDDDSGGGANGTDAQLTVNIGEDGILMLLANSFAPEMFGIYTIAVEPGGPSVLALAP